MSCPHFSAPIGIPVYTLSFTSNNQLLIGAGGGSSRSGVKNKLVSYKIDVRRKALEEDATFEFEADEDAPMCMDAHPSKPIVAAGVNGSEEHVKQGKNRNCRVFQVLEDKFELEKAFKTVESKDPVDYQRVIRFSQDGALVATGTTDGYINVFKHPEWDSLSPEPIRISTDDEILDVDINLEKEKLVCVVRDRICLINLRGKNIGKVVQTITSSSTVKNMGTVHFRAFRYGRGYTKQVGFAVLNGITKRGAYLIQYDAYSLDQLKRVKVSKTPITAFAISQDGGLLAFGTADLSIHVFDAISLRQLTTIKNAHGFAITCIGISPDRRLLVSASADNTCRVVSLPLQFPTGVQINPLYTLLLACIVAGLMLWLTSVVDIEPLFHSQTKQLTTTEPHEVQAIPTTEQMRDEF
ncbi:Guanine nucleotide-exchange factor SEC12 [Choanephora cucurbitarum]|uniref:Guanine nucleotide-exchange factor SEC12 n=1 Tax=Choanephora cucurbitarum TaxID=101091 RepID=A0A1C7N9J4_9FUNG|nr:Guanine nucleotide-exchange factor SEC12 [Choanephora cucurbitarum]